MAFGRHMIGKFSGKISQVAEFVGLNGNRSLSDDGRYVAFVRSALRDPKIFAEFKRHPDYRAILEHVSEEYGRKYLDLIVRNDAGLLGKMEQFKKNDLLGSPFLAHYPETGEISPSTLRYVYVASELRRLFGSSLGGKIAEIGICLLYTSPSPRD